MDEKQLATMKRSIVSSTITYYNALTGETLSTADPDVRAEFASLLDMALDGVEVDQTCWSRVKEGLFYDNYLAKRTEEGTITDIDLIRPGLVSGQFSDSVAFSEHNLRMAVARQTTGPLQEGTKTCSACGEEKPASKFRRRGGAKCNSCRSKEYRERAKAGL